jgi:alpha-methylacyl-CoA racemase
MLLADFGADVVRVDRPQKSKATGTDYESRRATADPRRYVMHRGRRSIIADLKNPKGRELLLGLVERADVLLEGFRPGVMERLGVGPDQCLARNERLIYGRMTGWGQDGPLADRAGHDINYIAIAGALDNCRRHNERPVPPVNMLGDFGGGGMLLALGVMSAYIAAQRSGRGQVVDAAMVDGAALLTTLFHGLIAQGRWHEEPGTNYSDTGAPYYEVYETADGRHVAVGALETAFYDTLVQGLGLDPAGLPDHTDETQWPALKAIFADAFRRRTRDEWEAVFEGTDACVAPVLSLLEATTHRYNTARAVFVERNGVVQPAPAPRFDGTPTELDLPAPVPGEHSDEIVRDWGLDASRI